MSAQTSSRIDDTDPADGWERALLDRQLERLDQLADMGMDIAGAIHRQVTGPEDALASEALANGAMDFARVSRAVRMTLALQSKLVRDFKTPIKAGSGGAHNDDDDDDGLIDFEAYWGDGTPITSAARKRVLRETVESLAKDCGLETEAAERMETEALEALEREPIYPAPGNRPFRKFLAQICEDLGLKPTYDATAPIAAAMGRGGVSPVLANDLASMRTAERGEERMVEGAGQAHPASAWFDGDSS